MLGNVKPYLPRLSDNSKTKYSAYYCGLCKTLGRQNGLLSRFMLNYDMVFVAMIYDSINGVEYVTKKEGCFANPFKKKDVLQQTKGTAYRADVLMLLAYYKILDDIRDEGIIKKAVYILRLPYFYFKYKAAAGRNPQLNRILNRQSRNQRETEKHTADIDSLCMPTALMVKAIMSGCTGDNNRFTTEQMGFFLGRVIYLTDALCDREEDENKHRFNPFNLYNYSREQAKEECFLALGELAHWYSMLNFEEIKEITDNIIYMSMARNIKFAGQKNIDGDKDGK